MGQGKNQLQKPTSENTVLAEQYFETNNLSINQTKTKYKDPNKEYENS
jgi:hypothetical protein